jgi:hypothetical protein
MTITTYAIPVTTTGAAGSASGSAQTETLLGELLDVYLEYDASAPNTTDITIAFASRGGNVLAVSDANTSGLFAPRQKVVDNTATAITDSHTPFVLSGPLTISVAGSDALDPAVTVYLRVRR